MFHTIDTYIFGSTLFSKINTLQIKNIWMFRTDCWSKNYSQLTLSSKLHNCSHAIVPNPSPKFRCTEFLLKRTNYPLTTCPLTKGYSFMKYVINNHAKGPYIMVAKGLGRSKKWIVLLTFSTVFMLTHWGRHCVLKWILRGHFNSPLNAKIKIVFEVIFIIKNKKLCWHT